MGSTLQVSKEEEVRDAVLNFARSCRYEEKHSRQVTRLALRLFDELHFLHQLEAPERFLLEMGSLLHDIGWIRGREAHHKTSRDLIMETQDLPLSREDRVLVALIARYHRKAMPEDEHKYYKDLDIGARLKICSLASLLRIADGLDRSHMSLVEDVACHLFPLQVVLQLKTKAPVSSEIKVAMRKADLFEKVFKRLLVIEQNP